MNLLDPHSLLSQLGPTAVLLVMFAETGLLIERPERPRLELAAERARRHLESYGVGRAVVLARFIPGVRTVMNPLAGALRIDVRVFTQWQMIGGAVWTVGLVLAGHVLGSQIPNVDRYLLPIIAVIVVISLIPVGLEILRHRRESRPVA